MPSSPLTTTLIQSTILNAISNILAQLIDQHQNTNPFRFHLNLPALLQFIVYAVIVVFPNFYWQRYLEARWPGFPRRLRWRWRRKWNWKWKWPWQWQWQSDLASSIHHNHHRANLPLNPIPASTSTSAAAAAAAATLKMQDAVITIIDDTHIPPSTTLIKDKPVLAIPRRSWFWSSPSPSPSPSSSGLCNFAIKFMLDQTVGSVVNIVLFLVLISLLKGDGWGRTVEMVHEDFGPIMLARLYYRPVVSGLLFTVVPVDRRVVFGSACGVIWGVYLSLYAAV
ncbi:uncharacterized protein ACLA_098240 [Aspergillus clavatus NRRL 1]|uniref:Mpv17 / PMP22 family protein n=1 Tax=Aspergillus clavatus (strain ATCC 1007 / CBS 513.65 / DSM 816 / NCTC 3887 / NRRL 1 / QM 1276 / 107) TaxID=344612 RepID=A1CMU5_ASPCL|nr:Mpv17 / PMP22 family protein [Aspergillus clavatus NRRL 1]EAW08882.1 Mpv17 / PMP22 family protein [Aspergillus clavatus NRRL 1]